jgi:hypothetical protein
MACPIIARRDTVADPATGSAFPGAGTPRQRRTDDDGRVLFNGLDPGSHQILAAHGGKRSEQSARVVSGLTSDVVIVLVD